MVELNACLFLFMFFFLFALLGPAGYENTEKFLQAMSKPRTGYKTVPSSIGQPIAFQPAPSHWDAWQQNTPRYRPVPSSYQQQYSAATVQAGVSMYSRLQKSCNKQAEQWKTTIDLLCLNREIGHAEAGKIIIFICGKSIVVFHCFSLFVARLLQSAVSISIVMV